MHAETFLREFAPLASDPGGVQKLRELALQLAVRGKLVPQIASEGDAKTILVEIEKEPDPAIKKRIAKYPTADPLYQTPINWVWTAIGRISRDWGQKVPDQPFQYIDVGGIDNLKGEISPNLELTQPEDAPSRARKLISRGTVLYSTVRPYLKNIAVVDRDFETEAIASTAFAIVHPLHGIVPEYVFYYLRSPDFVSYVEGQMMGVAYPAINDGKFFAAPIPLPPLAEQKRIVAKVDELMALCDALEARQAEETGLKRAAAASALHHLTEAKSPQETADRWSQLAPQFGELFDDLETIKALRGAILMSETSPPNASSLSVGKICDIQNGYAFKSSEFQKKGIRLVRNINIGHGKIDWSNATFLDPDRTSEFERFLLNDGDVVLTLDRPIISTGLKFAAITENDLPSLLLQRVARITPKSETLNRDYFCYWLQSANFINKIDPGRSNGVPHISTKEVSKLKIALPPLAEQKHIVAKVDELMALCDRLEQQVHEGDRLNAELMASLIHVLSETGPDGGGALERAGFADDAPALAESKLTNGSSSQILETKSAPQIVPAKPENLSYSQRAPNVGTKFQEAVLVAAIVKTFFQEGGEPIGNFRLQKAVYFARRKMGEHVSEMAYLKKAAGPYNPSMKYSGGIAIAKRKSWLREARGRFGFGHVPGAEVADAAEWIETYGYGEPARWVADHFRYKKNDEWETLATVDYALEHLRSLDIDPDAQKILQYVASDPEWHLKIEKLRLTEMSVGTAMLEVTALFNLKGEDDLV